MNSTELSFVIGHYRRLCLVLGLMEYSATINSPMIAEFHSIRQALMDDWFMGDDDNVYPGDLTQTYGTMADRVQDIIKGCLATRVAFHRRTEIICVLDTVAQMFDNLVDVLEREEIKRGCVITDYTPDVTKYLQNMRG